MTSRTATLLAGSALVVALTVALWLAGRGDGDAGVAAGSPAAGPWSGLASADAGSSVEPERLAPTAAVPRETATTLSGSLRVAGEGVTLAGIPMRVEHGSATTSDGQGRFLLSGLEPGRVELVVEAGPPFLPLRRTLELAAGENRLELELEARFALDVTVVRHAPRSEDDGQPLPGAHVRLLAPSLSEAGSGLRLGEEVSDAAGRCRLQDIPSGEHALVVEAYGHPPVRLLLPFRTSDRSRSGHLRTGTITVAVEMSSIPLQGRVLGPQRQPLAGALVCLDDRAQRDPGFARRDLQTRRPAPPYTFSDEDGSFRLLVAADAGEVALLVCARQEGLAAVVRREVAPQHLQRQVSVQVPRARAVDLRVLDVAGRPARGRLQVSDGVLLHDLVSDPVLGSIPGFVQDCAPSGDAEPGRLRLWLPDGGFSVRFDGTEPPGALGAWFVTVGAGQPTEHELRLDG